MNLSNALHIMIEDTNLIEILLIILSNYTLNTNILSVMKTIFEILFKTLRNEVELKLEYILKNDDKLAN